MVKVLALLVLTVTESFASTLSLHSPAFAANSAIPVQYTCDGADKAPPLIWQDAPDNTKTFVLIMDDPDAPTGVWDHWILLNIPAKIGQLAAGGETPSDALSLQNSWGSSGYRGPCPPAGRHHYRFRLYALDINLPLSGSASRAELEQAMAGHILSTAVLSGFYR